MRIDWRIAAGLLIIVGAVLGTVLAITFTRASSGSEAAQYEVTVQFNTTVTQDDLDEAGAFLRTFDDDLEYLILEIFPPIGQAVVTTEAADFCQMVETELGAKSYVDDVSCGPNVETDQADPDKPVSTDNEANS